ncbi:MAG: tyrosine-type recombinase/integrase [Rhodobacteraceae bacterium]|nr:tyrosine-type recombinase/integrase [Paracoccaceae bacterium]
MKFVNRNGHLHFRKRVPRRFADIEQREYVWISLHTDLEDVAKRKASAVWEEMLEAWEAKLHGDTEDHEQRLAAAKHLAGIRGYRYLPSSKVLKLPDGEFYARVRAVVRKDGTIDHKEADALLGTVPKPKLTLSESLKEFWKLADDRTVGKSADQLRRWRNPRIKAIKNLIGVIGDVEIQNITADDMLDFREWWIERIRSGGLSAHSANKDIIHIANVLRTVNKMKRLNLQLPLSDLSIKEGEKKTRPAFSVDWIRGKLLAPGALDGLNAEARAILLGMVNTGYRPSEGASLTAVQIKLDHAVPHISIEPVGRQLKSQYARRKIPLLGVSLEAFKQFPDGFPRYRDSAALSATVNKYLRTHGLLESPEHSMYSLRHSFEERMLAAGIDDRIRRDLFGHRLDRERYGGGASLELAQSLLKPLAL